MPSLILLMKFGFVWSKMKAGRFATACFRVSPKGCTPVVMAAGQPRSLLRDGLMGEEDRCRWVDRFAKPITFGSTSFGVGR
jgi:hypothetical protein